MATSQKRSKIDLTKYKDKRYLHDYFVGLNKKKINSVNLYLKYIKK